MVVHPWSSIDLQQKSVEVKPLKLEALWFEKSFQRQISLEHVPSALLPASAVGAFSRKRTHLRTGFSKGPSHGAGVASANLDQPVLAPRLEHVMAPMANHYWLTSMFPFDSQYSTVNHDVPFLNLYYPLLASNIAGLLIIRNQHQPACQYWPLSNTTVSNVYSHQHDDSSIRNCYHQWSSTTIVNSIWGLFATVTVLKAIIDDQQVFATLITIYG